MKKHKKKIMSRIFPGTEHVRQQIIRVQDVFSSQILIITLNHSFGIYRLRYIIISFCRACLTVVFVLVHRCLLRSLPVTFSTVTVGCDIHSMTISQFATSETTTCTAQQQQL